MNARILASGLVVLVASVVGDAVGQQYSVTDLGTLPGYEGSHATGINDSGQVVGYASSSNANGGGNNQVAFLYSGGAMQSLQVPLGSTATAINNSGQIVVNLPASFVGQNTTLAWLYSGGALHSLGSVGTMVGSAGYGINSRGQVVGVAYESSGVVGQDVNAGFISTNGSMSAIYQSPGTVATGINDSGQVIGNVGNSSVAFFDGNTVTYLPTFAGVSSEVTAINDNGQVVGNQAYGKGGFLWESGIGLQDIPEIDGSSTFPNAINNLGQVVGLSSPGAFLYSNGTTQDLNTLIPSNSGWTLEDATGINDSGQICGWGFNASGQTDAFLLTPVPTPEPSTLALLGAGALALLARGWRRARPSRGQ